MLTFGFVLQPVEFSKLPSLTVFLLWLTVWLLSSLFGFLAAVYLKTLLLSTATSVFGE